MQDIHSAVVFFQEEKQNYSNRCLQLSEPNVVGVQEGEGKLWSLIVFTHVCATDESVQRDFHHNVNQKEINVGNIE